TFALERAKVCSGKKFFIATAVPFDDEMCERIRKHREERAATGFETLEAPLDLAAALRAIPEGTDVTLVDCLTVWLGNLYHEHQNDEVVLVRAIDDFIAAVRDSRTRVIFVTNEVGCGIVPENPLARKFRDAQGLLNRRVAALCDDVYMVVCGIPMHLTPFPPPLSPRLRSGIERGGLDVQRKSN
ncbi:MAG: bifunctional adenosylcobinamide kinase/adenosylcobinamide-phosphate guanylyltransferase, partial [Fibrobacterota bacterium]